MESPRPNFLLGLGALLCVAFALRAQTLPAVPAPSGNPVTASKAVLGKILFWDEQLSDDHTMACGTCHRPEAGGGDPRALLPQSRHPGPDLSYGTADDGRGSPGVIPCGSQGSWIDDGLFFPTPAVTARKSPGIFGAQYDTESYWDGRAGPVLLAAPPGGVVLSEGAALENQAASVLMSTEMGCQGRSWAALVQKLPSVRPLRLATNLPADCQAGLTQDPTYPALFARAFGDSQITRERIVMAIASYERTLVPDQTPYDAFVGGQSTALTPSEASGLAVLVVHYCVFCHVPPAFSDAAFHNIGVRPPAEDLGRAAVTLVPSDRGRFKTPSLRNAGLRAPYFHNGSVTTLAEVVQFYERGGDAAENREPIIAPFSLSATERADLVAFLQNGLTDPRCAQRLPPFDRPTLRSELPANPVVDGIGSPGSGGFVPSMMAASPPFTGTSHFELGVARGAPGSLAFLVLATAPAQPSTFFGPHPVFVQLDTTIAVFPATLAGIVPAAGRGFASMVLPIPDAPVLNGQSLHAQWALADPAGVMGLAVSNAARFTIFSP